jgi:hypothetical protein
MNVRKPAGESWEPWVPLDDERTLREWRERRASEGD